MQALPTRGIKATSFRPDSPMEYVSTAVHGTSYWKKLYEKYIRVGPPIVETEESMSKHRAAAASDLPGSMSDVAFLELLGSLQAACADLSYLAGKGFSQGELASNVFESLQGLHKVAPNDLDFKFEPSAATTNLQNFYATADIAYPEAREPKEWLDTLATGSWEGADGWVSAASRKECGCRL